MNRIYRLIFNRSLGLIQVVAEIAKGSGRGTNAGGAAVATLRPLNFALWTMLGFVSVISTVLAQVVADPNAPGNQRPTVLQTPNGIPQVNITTPSAAGVSRNTYSQFDVDSKGLILNNSRTNANTQLAGWVSGNPWLATGTAKVILNEVNSSNPSYLNGYIEIAGDRAQLVIANPAGISVSGGGFLNASRLTLTTGKPILGAGGSLDGYRVDGGAIRIDGAGLDATKADYTDLITRSLQLNGGIWANQLQATLGTNVVSADHSQVTAIAPTGTAPAFALDSSALGGMYANKITLVGTENGVGVHNAGTIGAQAGELMVTVDGRIENTGTLQAKTDTHIVASGGIANAGTLAATRELTLDTPADLDNRGGTLNAQRIAVNAASLRNRGGSIEQTGAQGLALHTNTLSNRDGGRIGLAAPTTGGGTNGGSGSTTGGSGSGGTGTGTGGGTGTLPLPDPLPEGTLNIATILDNDGGYINSGGGVSLDIAQGLDNSGGHLGVHDLTLTQGDLGNAGGELSIAGNAVLHVGRLTNDGGHLEVAGALDIATQTLSNRAGVLTHSGTAPATVQVTGTLDNTSGSLATNADTLALSAGVLVNESGRIEHAGTGGMTVQAHTLNGAGGTIATASALTLSAGQVDHRGATLGAAQYAITADTFDNRGGTITASGLSANRITVAGALDNGEGGTIASNNDLNLTANTFGNAGGTVQAASGTLAIDAATLDGEAGTLASNGVLTLTGETTDLRGGTTQAQRIAIDTGSLVTAGGKVTATGPEALAITARDMLDNTAGKIATNGALQLATHALTNANGVISTAGSAPSQVTATTTLENSGGSLASTGDLTVAAQDVINQGGTVQSAAALTISANGRLDNSAAGTVASGGDLRLTTPLLDNATGTIQSAGGTLLIDATTLNGAAGTIASNGALNLTGEITDLRDGSTSAQSITIDTGMLTTAGGSLTASGTGPLAITARTALDNTAGDIASNGSVQLTTGALTNTDGSITAAGTDASRLQVSSAFDNTRGTVATIGAATVRGGTLTNTAGRVYSAGGLAVASEGDLVNRDAGRIQSDAGLTLTAGGTLDNTGGIVDATEAAQVMAAQIANVGGQIMAGAATNPGATLTVTTAGTLNNQGGTIGNRGGDITVQAGSLDNSGAGTVVAQRDLTLTTASVNNATGTIYATHFLRYENAAGTLNNAGGQFGAGDTAWLKLSTISNTNGGRIQAGTVWLTTPTLDISGGEVAANQLHADLTTVNGLGRLYGAQWLDANFSGDFTHVGGQRFESDGLLELDVAGTFTNQGTLQTAGELDVSAANLVNQGTINASNDTGTGLARLTVAGTLDNQAGASIEGDIVTLSATDLTNTGDISGNTVDIEADTLTNGRDLGTALAPVDYGEGFIGAADDLQLRVAQSLRNLDAEIFSGGDLNIAGRAAGTRVASLENLSGRISAEGDVSIAADSIVNARRVFETERYVLTAAEQGSNTTTDTQNMTLTWAQTDAQYPTLTAWCENYYATSSGRNLGCVDRDSGPSGDQEPVELSLTTIDTVVAVNRVTRMSAAGQILSGGDMVLDGNVRNATSAIAARGNLAVVNGTLQNIAWQPAAEISRSSDLDVFGYKNRKSGFDRDWVRDRWLEGPAATYASETVAIPTPGYEYITFDAGPAVAATATSGQALTIAQAVTNTTVSSNGGLAGFGPTGGGGGGGTQAPMGPAAGTTVGGTSGASGAASQVVGTPEHPLPGLVAADNGMFDLHADPNSPFLVTTAPRFAGPDNTGANYLLGLLGVDTYMHKRLGDGYYEQRLVMEQILQLTGRRSLNGGNGASEYRDLMAIAAQEAGRLGLSLGAPLTSSQIAALDRDIVWLVEMEVNGPSLGRPTVGDARGRRRVPNSSRCDAGLATAASLCHRGGRPAAGCYGVPASHRGAWLDSGSSHPVSSS